MACSLLYSVPVSIEGDTECRPSLDLEKLYLFGGVEMICNEVGFCESMEITCISQTLSCHSLLFVLSRYCSTQVLSMQSLYDCVLNTVNLSVGSTVFA